MHFQGQSWKEQEMARFRKMASGLCSRIAKGPQVAVSKQWRVEVPWGGRDRRLGTACQGRWVRSGRQARGSVDSIGGDSVGALLETRGSGRRMLVAESKIPTAVGQAWLNIFSGMTGFHNVQERCRPDGLSIMGEFHGSRAWLARLSHPTPRTGGYDFCKWLIDNG